MLIRLRKSAPLLFPYGISRFSHDVTCVIAAPITGNILCNEPQHDKTNKMTCVPNWVSAKSDQSCCLPDEGFCPLLPIKNTAKTLIRLDGCPGWSQSSLGTQVILFVLLCSHSKKDLLGQKTELKLTRGCLRMRNGNLAGVILVDFCDSAASASELKLPSSVMPGVSCQSLSHLLCCWCYSSRFLWLCSISIRVKTPSSVMTGVSCQSLSHLLCCWCYS